MEVDTKVKFNDTETAFSYKSDAELRKANFIFTLVNNPVISGLAVRAVRLGLFLHLPIKALIKNTVFDHFCGGENIEQCRPIIKNISDHNVRAILDYSVEGEKTEEGFDKTTSEILQTFEEAKGNDSIPFGVFKMTGLADTALLEKINSKKTLTAEEVSAFERIRNRVDRICKKAHDYQIKVLIDAEETWIQDPIDQLAYEMMKKYNTTSAIVFNTYQMYRADMLTNMRNAHHEATMHNYHLGVKMVRGAYMEKERERAEKMNYPDPIQPSKEATDESFNKALAFCIDNKQRISLMCGSHNDYSNQYLTVLMEKHSMKNNDSRVWFAQLFGMSDTISFNLAREGYNVAKYLPYGPVKAVVPYLLRRAEENTSVAGQSSRELTQIRTELSRRKSAHA
ncbi:MAG: proline dehydrogenase family protein [Cyclobacteriaceae bacterium]|jgi:proline dehydrogenase|nr:proline dehydrogenase family protein [Cyclobacteriaceae bacterium]